MKVIVEADGGSRGNPGPAGFGAVVRDATDGQVLLERAESLGRVTNNVAEYRGLIAGLLAATELSADVVAVRMDSKLVVEQMSGRWRVKHPDLQPLHAQARTLARGFAEISFEWIPRARNAAADRLANEAMDAAAEGRTWQPSTVEQSAPAEESTVDDDAEPVQLFLVCAAATEPAAADRLAGRHQRALSPVGEAQAKAAAGRLAERGPFAAVLSSPLPRARQTAAAVAAAVDRTVSTVDELTECDYGEWEGHTAAEVAQRWPREWADWRRSVGVAPPGGESPAALARRVGPLRDRLLAGAYGPRVVLVSHPGPIALLLRLALDAPPAAWHRLRLDPAGVSALDWPPDGAATIRAVNCLTPPD